VSWGELRRHQTAIERYAYRFLQFDGGAGNACRIKPRRQMVDEHADGSYAVLFFDVECTRAPARLTLQYQLFFAIDPSHRGIFVANAADTVATALLAPDNARIGITL
jgi:hypothetical protein